MKKFQELNAEHGASISRKRTLQSVDNASEPARKQARTDMAQVTTDITKHPILTSLSVSLVQRLAEPWLSLHSFEQKDNADLKNMKKVVISAVNNTNEELVSEVVTAW